MKKNIQHESLFTDKSELFKKTIEYAKYLYEEEVKRSERFHNATKTYLVFIFATLTSTIGILKWLEIKPLQLLSSNLTIFKWVYICIFILAFFLIVLSLIFSILVLKTWRIEKLCDPDDFFKKIMDTMNEQDLLEEILSNFLVAAKKNGEVNNKKGKLLSMASQTYHTGLILLIIGGVLNVVIL